jgi:hypothetical protein
MLSCGSQGNTILFDTKVVYTEVKTIHSFYYSSTHPEIFLITNTASDLIERKDKIYINNNAYFLAMKDKSINYGECSALTKDNPVIYNFKVATLKVSFNNLECTKIILTGKRSNYAIEILVSEDNAINNANLINLNFNTGNQPVAIKGLLVKIDEVAYLGKERVERNWLTYVKTEKTNRELDIDLNRFK